MIILNMYGKISSICVSNKLKIYISNLPRELDNNWNQELVEDMLQEIKERKIFAEKHGNDLPSYDLKKICIETFGLRNLSDNLSELEYLQIIADNLICIYFDYEYEDMPFFDWTTNCFDGRLCEEDYSEKFMNFLHFIVRKDEKFKPGEISHFPSYIYTTNRDREYHFLLGALNGKFCCNLETYIKSLQYWGKLIDNFLVNQNDYLQLDYLINSVHKDNEYNSYHLFKVFSLCEMLLVKNSNNGKSIEFDKKLSRFLSAEYTENKKSELAQMIRQMRNKIGHGDFLRLNELIEKYAKRFMDDHFNYDYTEYSRLNWIYLHLCCELNDALARILFLLLTDRKEFEKIKQL